MANVSENEFFKKTKRGRGRVKHEILERYLKSYFPTMGQSKWYGRKPIVYIDGFAGPGKYIAEDQSVEIGSPLVAYNAATNNKRLMNYKSYIQLIFVEKDPKLAQELRVTLKNEEARKPDWVRGKVKFEVICGEFADILESILERREFKWSPMLIFADPFGYKAIPNKLLQAVLARKNMNQRVPTEVFLTVMDSFARRFISDARQASSLSALMGHKDNWHHLTVEADYTPEERRVEFIELFIQNLCSEIPKARALKFSIRNQKNRHVYHLVYVTSHPKGATDMKRAMWKKSCLLYDMVFSEFMENRDGPPPPKDKQKLAADIAQTICAEFAGRSVLGKVIRKWIVDDPVVDLNFIHQLKQLLSSYQSEPGKKKFKFDEMEYFFPRKIKPEMGLSERPVNSAGTSNKVAKRKNIVGQMRATAILKKRKPLKLSVAPIPNKRPKDYFAGNGAKERKASRLDRTTNP